MNNDSGSLNDRTKKIWIEFSDQLKRFISRRVSDSSTADDILQDVFIKIHSNIDNLKDDQKVRGWIYRIARNSITDYYRKTKNNPTALKDRYGYEMFADEEAEQEILSGLEAIVKRLPIKYSEAIYLTEFEGLKQKELAEKIGLSLSAAKNRVQRARQMIKDDLMRCCHFEFDSYGTIISYHPITCCCCHQHTEDKPA
jgi:RNA polymerase sigma-70 factor (ECF subfamily)